MIELGTRAAVSAVVIAAVTIVAQKNAAMAGWISAFPMTTSLALIWLSLGGMPSIRLGGFTAGVVLGLVPTAIVLLITAVLLRRDVPLPLSGSAGIVAWIAMTLAARQIGLLGH